MKEALFLWNPATYDPTRGGSSYRTQANFIQSSFLVLDFDNGTLSPEEFENIFWKEAKRGHKHSFIICNSFSRYPKAPNKFRVIFFYQRPARSIEEHQAAYDYVLRRLEEWGHTEKSSEARPQLQERSAIVLDTLHQPMASQVSFLPDLRHQNTGPGAMCD